jgi:hypothetical protein
MLYFSDNSGSKNSNSLNLKAILELSWYKKEFNSEGDESISVIHPIFNWLNIVTILKFSMSVSCRISSFLVWLLVGRENLENSKIKNGEIEKGEEDIETADCEKFFLNYADRCAISLHSANLIINKATIETANTY